MDVQQKQIQQGFIQSNLTGISAMVTKLIKDRDENAAQLQNLNMNKGTMFTSEYIERETMTVKARFAVKMRETFTDIDARLENLRKLLAARDDVLDLTNPAFQTALTFIQAVGGTPNNEQAAQINKSFQFDQQALNAIYSAYGKRDLGGIGKMIYNRDEVIDGLKELANNCTVKEGSVNYFASKLSKLAAIEGVELPENPDERGIMEAFRIGAGLK